MGEPGRGNARSPTNESIVREEGTRGSETSKYPEEKKENSISLVVASEEVEGKRHLTIADLKLLERSSEEGDRPVREGEDR